MDEGHAPSGASRPARPSGPTRSGPSGYDAAACAARGPLHGVGTFSLLGDWPSHAPPQFLLHLRRHAVAPGLPLELEEVAPAVLAADEGEAQEVEKPARAKASRRPGFRRI